MEKRDAVVVFNGDTTAKHLMSIITPEFIGNVIVNGNIGFDDNIEFKGGLFVVGDLLKSTNDFGIIINLVDLYVSGIIDVNQINVIQDFINEGDIDSYDINVSGDIINKGNINSCDIKVYGDIFNFGNIDSLDINVGGDAINEGNITTAEGEFEMNVCGEIFNKGYINASYVNACKDIIDEGKIIANHVNIG